MFRVKWHAVDVGVHASPRRGELLHWDCSVLVILTALTFWGVVVVQKAEDLFVKSFEYF